ncbi:response regulator transcription factor [Echinicola sediminis]
MSRSESIKALYLRKFGSVPEELHHGIGHFNVFRIEPFRGKPNKPLPYQKRDYYKVTILEGKSTVEFADRSIHVPHKALVFSNPSIPYRWEHSDSIHLGHYAIFNEEFFYQYGSLSKYPVFQPSGNHVFELTDEQFEWVKDKFEKMHAEIETDYEFKYDLLRALTQELIHFGLKLQPLEAKKENLNNASNRITSMFLELLERQFPIDDMHPQIQLRSASDFAERLNIHTNHLNRALKETTQKTTTQLVTDRILQESKLVLKQTSWSVAEIAYALGFTEPTHFNNFFKKHVNISPRKFRNI